MLFRDVASNGPTHTTSRGTWRADAKLHNSFSTLRATSVWGYTHAYVRTYVDSYIHTFIHSFIHTMPPDILRFKVLLYRPWPAQTNHFQFRFPFHPSGGKDIIYIYTTIYIYLYIVFPCFEVWWRLYKRVFSGALCPCNNISFGFIWDLLGLGSNW
jgi:hypothetical protein